MKMRHKRKTQALAAYERRAQVKPEVQAHDVVVQLAYSNTCHELKRFVSIASRIAERLLPAMERAADQIVKAVRRINGIT